MKKGLTNIRKFLKLSDEDVLMIVLAFFCFSLGIWINFRQLWLEDLNFTITEISRILSVALICSSVIAAVVSLFSTKVKTKNVIMMAMLFRCLSLAALFRVEDPYLIKAFMLLSIMCETLFAIAYYPMLSTVNKSDETYRKYALISYLSKDVGVILCGLLLGVVVGNIIFSLEACLFIALISNILGTITLLLFETDKEYSKEKSLPFKKSIKKIFESKATNWYLFTQFITSLSYGIIFGLMMLILTKYLGMSVAIASIFIIVSNLLGSLACAILNPKTKKMTTKTAVIIKYGIRALGYLIAFLMATNVFVYILAIGISYVTTRIFEDKVNGVYIRKIKTDSQFLFGNILYFITTFGEGAGIFLAGCVLNPVLKLPFKYLFLVASLFTIIQILLHFQIDKVKDK